MTTVTSDMTLTVDQEIEIAAPIAGAFEALLAQLGPRSETPDGQSMSMKIEPWPGGRWFRDLGDDQGHLWGHVQVIKQPTLLEITGPLFMSYPVMSRMQFQLTDGGQTTVLALHHQALGLIQDEHRQGVVPGWQHFLEGVRKHAERQ